MHEGKGNLKQQHEQQRQQYPQPDESPIGSNRLEDALVIVELFVESGGRVELENRANQVCYEALAMYLLVAITIGQLRGTVDLRSM
jgi:hypothetical protein